MTKKQKKKQKYCIVCGRKIRSGYKYCYEHRNYVKPKVIKEEKKNVDLQFGAILVFILGTLLYFATKSILGVIITFSLYALIYFAYKKRVKDKKGEEEVDNG